MKDLVVAVDQKMSSLEIAELTGKQHKNVVRDIENLIEQGAITGLNFELSEYKDGSGKRNKMYLLDFEATMTLVTGYDAKRRSIVIQRWISLEKGEAQPLLTGQPVKPIKTPTRQKIASDLKADLSIAQLFGLEGNQAKLTANKMTSERYAQFGINPLIESGVDLVVEDQERLLTPTDIANMTDIKSNRAVNKMLMDMGFQTKDEAGYKPTDLGRKYSTLIDTSKKHKATGAPVQQLKWKEPIVKVLVAEATA